MNDSKYLDIKKQFKLLRRDALNLRESTIYMAATNSWIFNDANLFEKFDHLCKMQNNSCNDMLDFALLLELIDKGISFSVADFEEEFAFIKENLNLEVGYFSLMVDHMQLLTDPNYNELTENKLIENHYNSISCKEQVLINQKLLKKIIKERRDYFE